MEASNEYRLELTDLLPVFRIYIEGRKTSAFIPFPNGKGVVPMDVYGEAERMVDNQIF